MKTGSFRVRRTIFKGKNMKKSTVISIFLIVAVFLALSMTLVACLPVLDTAYQLKFDSNNGSGETIQHSLKRSELNSYCPFQKEGYHLAGWAESAQGAPIDDDATLKNGMTLYAVWEINVYTVRFTGTDKRGNAYDLIPEQKVEHGAYATVPTIYDFWQKVQGYAFGGFPSAANEPITQDSVFDANLSDAESTAKFFLDDNTAPFFSFSGNLNDPLPSPPEVTTPREGFEFAGWAANGVAFEEGKSKLGYGNTRYDAIWNITPPALPTVYMKDGEQDSIDIKYGQTINITARTRTAPDGVIYRMHWYAGKFNELAEDAEPIDDPSASSPGVALLVFGAEQVVDGGYDFTVVLTAQDVKDQSSFARVFKSVHVNVLKADCSLTLSFESAKTQNWTGEPLEFKILHAVSPSNYRGEKVFEYYLDGEPLDDERCVRTEGGATVKVAEGGSHTLKIVLKANEFYAETYAETKLTVRSVAAEIRSRDGSVKSDISKWYTLEEALNLDPSSFNKFSSADKDVLYLIPKGNVHLSAGEYTLNKDAALILPYELANADALSAHREDNVPLYYPHAYDGSAPVHLLELVDGARLIVEGKLLVGGESSNCNEASFQGATQGAFSQIDLHEGAIITVADGGLLDCYGYIEGAGELTLEKGAKLCAPFVVRDFRGGTNMMSTTKHGVSAFNQFDMPNIRVQQIVKSGATVVGHMSFFAENAHIDSDVTVISDAPGATLVRLLSGELRVLHTYAYADNVADDPNLIAHKFKNTTSLTLTGEAETGYIVFKADEYLMTFTTMNLPFAIPHGYDITLAKGSTLTVLNTFKLLPGAKLTVDKGATLNIGSALSKGTLVVYDAGAWTDNTVAGVHVYPSDMADAELVVNGTLSLNSGAFGGRISSAQAGATAVFESGVSLSVTVSEGNSQSASTAPTNKVDVTLEANMPTNDNSLSAGTYVFDGEVWRK